MQESKGIDRLIESVSEKENFKELVELGKEYINAKKMTTKEHFKIQVSERVYSLVVLAICMSAVIYLSAIKVLDGISSGTLIGAIIGYSLAKTRSSSDND